MRRWNFTSLKRRVLAESLMRTKFDMEPSSACHAMLVRRRKICIDWRFSAWGQADPGTDRLGLAAQCATINDALSLGLDDIRIRGGRLKIGRQGQRLQRWREQNTENKIG
jgi:hypothetical protein